jgi:hypothetical protein
LFEIIKLNLLNTENKEKRKNNKKILYTAKKKGKKTKKNCETKRKIKKK